MSIDERKRERYFNLSCVADWAGRIYDYEDDDEKHRTGTTDQRQTEQRRH
jgi:hypothetical protein